MTQWFILLRHFRGNAASRLVAIERHGPTTGIAYIKLVRRCETERAFN